MPTRSFFYQVFFFALAGTAGFIVDASVLNLVAPYLGPYQGRLLSFLTAVVTTWLLNRRLTFAQRSSALNLRSEFSRYLVLMLFGGTVNYGVYSLLVLHSVLTQNHLVLGVAAGSLAGMVVNYLTSRFLLYRFSGRRDQVS